MFKIGFGIPFLDHLQIDIPVADPDYPHHALVLIYFNDVQPDLLPYDFAFQSLP